MPVPHPATRLFLVADGGLVAIVATDSHEDMRRVASADRESRGPADRARTRARSLIAACICLAASVLGGCGPRTTRFSPAKEGELPRAVTAWVFDPGAKLALAWHAFPMVDMVNINAGMHRHGRLVLLCNLGGQSEVLRPSHAYVLDVNDGRVLASIGGPWGLASPEVRFTERYAYFKDWGQWKAFDLQEKRVTSSPPPPPAEGLPPAERCKQVWHEVRDDGTYVWLYQLGRRYLLAVSGDGGKLTFDLEWHSPDLKPERVRLCELDYRMYPGGDNLLFVDDGERLVFSWSWYVICVNMAPIADRITPMEP